ncbi:MAG TPA: choice-of-anchor L domain-containing protein, partial [Bacteroidales bacterium]|nr:choice-of-anchor L domain-containing protein [Bacteroidales bacterium]
MQLFKEKKYDVYLYNNKKLYIIIFILLVFINKALFSQLVVYNTQTPAQLVQNILVGSGVSISNVTYSGSVNSIGAFYTGPSSTNLGLSTGIILSTGDVSGSSAVPPGSPVWDFASTSIGTGSDPQLAALIPGYSIYDAVVLQFDFIPLDDTIKFRYVFGSEEYPEWVSSSYNDVFGFFISGPNPFGGSYVNKNIALIPGTNLPVTIDNVNNVIPSYPQYYVDNEGMNGTTIVYDGFTKVLTAWALVVPCQMYHIKIAIGDAGDDVYDSAVFLEANSFSTNAIKVSVAYSAASIDTAAIEGCTSATVGFKLSSPTTSPLTINYTIGGTAQNGVDYLPIPSSVTVPSGQDSAGFIINPIADGITEAPETVVVTIQGTVCGGLSSATAYIKDKSNVNLVVSNDTMTCGNVVTLNVNAYGGLAPLNYMWNDGNNMISSSSSVTVSPLNTTTYYVSVTDACGSIATEDVIVYYGSGGLVNAGKDTIICEGGAATLAINSNFNVICTWSNGVTGNINIVTPDSTTTYSAYIITPCDTIIDSVTVFVEKMPMSSFIASNTKGCKPLLVNFTNLSSNISSLVTYSWDFGDGTTAPCQAVIAG